MTNLLLVRSVRKGEIMEKSTEKYHGTLMNTCGRVGHAPAASFKLAQEYEFKMPGRQGRWPTKCGS